MLPSPGSTVLTNYLATNPDLEDIKFAAAECGNKGLKRIRKTVSYSNESNAIVMIGTFISVWNRKRILQVSSCYYIHYEKSQLVNLINRT